MQKDLSEATDTLAEGVNELYSTKTKDLFHLVKVQVDEIDRRGKIIMKMEESIKLQQKNVQILQEQNRQLEAMLEDMKKERVKFLEEIAELKAKNSKVSKPRTRKQVIKKKVGDAEQTSK